MAGHYIVLSGGVGGAKLVSGLSRILAAEELVVVGNTGDDFEYLGLPICPDLDTLMYTLADVANPDTGWGIRGETWQFMAALEALGGETWFRLGDRDLATHVRRRLLLDDGLTLSAATARLCEHFGVTTRLVPMSDQPVRTILSTSAGELGFQDYFVRLKAEPRVERIAYAGAEAAAPAPGLREAFRSQELRGVIIGPSNPWLSIDPILSIPELRPMIVQSQAPVVAISPIVGGSALKGPAAKLMGELGVETSVVGIAEHYRKVAQGLIIDHCDRSHADRIVALGLEPAMTSTVMRDTDDRIALAQYTLELLASSVQSLKGA